MEKKKKENGAQKRRKRKEKEHRAKEATNKMPKLTETSLSPTPQTLSYANTGTTIPPELLTVTESVAGLASVESESVEAGSSSADGKTTVDPYSTDPAHWGEIDESVQVYWAERGPESCQNTNVSFQASEQVYKHQKRHFSKSHFKRKMLNGEYIERPWLLYFPSTGAAYCFACRIFSNANTQSNFETGFSDWKHATEPMLTYVSLAAASRSIDTELVVSVKFLAERGLALRGASDQFGRTDNGNYLGILELISEFDPFLKSHIEKYGNAGSGKPSYLSSQTCEEFIQLMVKMAKYFSISVDSTPDVAHVDQLTFVLRYVSPEGHSQEHFLKFLPIESHTGEALCASVLKVLEEMGIDIANCRGQCYDNATNMSGVYNGLQARMKELNPLVEWVPCAAHTLNLVGVNSVNCCFETADFFQFVQNLFNFCSKSTARWKVVIDGLQPNANKRIETLKSLSNTRWAAHADATQAVAALQSVELDLCTAVDLVGSLRECINLIGLSLKQRSCLQQFHKLTELLVEDQRLQRHFLERAPPQRLTYQLNKSSPPVFFLVIVDRLLSEINHRYIAYNLNNTFGFLNNFSGVTVPELRNKASHLQSKYSADLEMDFVEEIVQFKDFIRDKGITSAPLLLQFIREKKLQDIFPNVDIAFRLYLTFPVTNASGERSSSKLKMVKNRLRSTMGQERRTI
uniref:TTF-type domain-containing protein n=1 Tax=Poecilia reticulata TaxID=8081 RepID=A0A3P9PR07_POERE